MTLSCVVLDDYQGAAAEMADWGSLDGRVQATFLREHLTGDELIAALRQADIVVTLRERVPFPAAVLDRLPRLSLLVASGMRNSSIDYEAAAANGVTVCGTSSASTPPVELTWALILGLARGLVPEAENMRSNGPWQSTVGMDLHGARLGVLGLGRIGSEVARIGQAFGMVVSAWSQHLTPEAAAQAGVARAPSLAELLVDADIVTIHLQLSERTHSLLGAEQLALLKPGALLVNTSRSAIVPEAALLGALRSGRLGGAALDVFDEEPLPPDHPLRTAPRLLATPHLGYVSRNNLRRYYTEAVEDIAAFLSGSPIRLLS